MRLTPSAAMSLVSMRSNSLRHAGGVQCTTRVYPAISQHDGFAARAIRYGQAIIAAISIDLQNAVKVLQKLSDIFSAAPGRVVKYHARWIITAPAAIITGKSP